MGPHFPPLHHSSACSLWRSLSATFQLTKPSQSYVPDLFQGHGDCPKYRGCRRSPGHPPHPLTPLTAPRGSSWCQLPSGTLPVGKVLQAAWALGRERSRPDGCRGDLPAGGEGWALGVPPVVADFTAEWVESHRGCPWRGKCFQKLWSEREGHHALLGSPPTGQKCLDFVSFHSVIWNLTPSKHI